MSIHGLKLYARAGRHIGKHIIFVVILWLRNKLFLHGECSPIEKSKLKTRKKLNQQIDFPPANEKFVKEEWLGLYIDGLYP